MRRALVAGLSLLLVGCASAAAQAPTSHLTTAVRSLHLNQVIDSVPCLQSDLPAHHIHVHLLVLIDGVNLTVPAGIGVGRPWGTDPDGFIATGSCFAWMHTHDTTGIVHIVTPEEKTFTLGQFFEIWGQPLAANGALGYHGRLRLMVNGASIPGDPRQLPLVNLQNIVIELGRAPSTPPPALYDFAALRR